MTPLSPEVRAQIVRSCPTRAAWLRLLGIYLAFGFLQLTFQIGSMADRRGVWIVGLLVAIGILVFQECFRWVVVRRPSRLASALFSCYALLLMSPNISILLRGGPRAPDLVALAAIGWLMLFTPWLRERLGDVASSA